MNCISYALRNTEKPIDLTADNSDVAEFTDGADINEVYKNAVEAAVSYGVINGMGDGTFAPKANLTRAQATVIITKLADMLETVR